jgi:CAAX protease family protein
MRLPPRPDVIVRAGPPELPAPSWGILDAVPLFLMPLGFIALLAAFLAQAVSETDAGFFTILSAAQSVALAAGVVFWLRYMKPAPLRTLGSLARPKQSLLLGAALGAGMLVLAVIVAATLQAIVSAILGHHVATSSRIPDSVQGGWLWALAPTLFLFAPIGEEMFFRGFLYRALRQRLDVTPAVLISAAAFGAAHVYPLVIPVIFVDGVILALLYEKRRSLLACIAAHAANNLIILVILLAAKP